MHAEFRCDPARRTADAAADIEDALAGPRIQQLGQLLGGDDAAAVEMVERRKGLRRDRDIGTDRPQRGKHPFGDAATAVMLLDRLFGRHRRPPLAFGVWRC